MKLDHNSMPGADQLEWRSPEQVSLLTELPEITSVDPPPRDVTDGTSDVTALPSAVSVQKLELLLSSLASETERAVNVGGTLKRRNENGITQPERRS